MKYLLFLSLVLISCTDNEITPPKSNITVESTIIFNNKNWEGDIIILPTGERILLTGYKFTTYGGTTSVSTTATLLPPLKAEK